MIEVVVRRNEHLQHYRCTCQTCKSDLRFAAKDLTFDRDPSGRGEGSASLTCPVCNQCAARYAYTNDVEQFERYTKDARETPEQYAQYKASRP